jgi:methylamine dehydrogenase accessory protein MauD
MTEALLISNVVLWLVVVALCIVVAALARQIGVLHERIAPAGALMLAQGLKPGEPVAPIALRTLDGRDIQVGGASAQQRSTLLFFLSPTCPVCKELLPAIASLRRDERRRLDVVLASDGDLEMQRAFIRAQGIEDYPYVVSTELGLTFQVGKLPYAALIDPAGILSARGLVNSREHLESLIAAQEMRVASVQDYLRQRQGRDAA